MPEKVNLKGYFDRIGFAGSIAPTLATLETLHALHPAAIPFENISPLIGEPVPLDQPSLEKKLLSDRRGGYCFEHNLLFMRVLQDLDYTVRPLLARGLMNNPDNQKLTHLLLLVDINGQNYIADVGHGGLTLTAPLRLRADVEQTTPHETFRLVGGDPDWTLEARLGDAWEPIHAFTLDPAEDGAIEAANEMMAHTPGTSMVSNLRVALSPPGRRLKLLNTGFTIKPVDGEKEQREITSMEALRSVLTTEFGLVLPNDERLEPALSRLFPLPPDLPDQAPV
ncbi:N-hydroxyarylamine O-acetyltransferase [Devosia lucknowensis]|uniref:N-hydroxyarylamine O-acetyltransferase n=1 Tax=Devosia lucknowensis TaxID=1096929 RepID=A0A1Y6G8U5_9HYPH|nr:arylamine N-acetyltransferase [Devosia lucknowensis]SMQ85753.1 N-hydroxyarylamine O-acetyltransferase [Devosia lucknowensis]